MNRIDLMLRQLVQAGAVNVTLDGVQAVNAAA